jgi:uncharacterized protein (TIGR01319 family)
MAIASSILAVDFGNVNTRAILIDLVEGVYYVVAQAQEPTTAGFPTGDVAAGLSRALRKLGLASGRRLVGADGSLVTPEQPDRSGVDTFVATASIGRPLRTVLIGLVPEISLTSGLRAAAGTYVNIVDTISLEDARTPEDVLNALVEARPDLIFLTGGTEAGAREPVLELARIARLAVRLLPFGHKPVVVFAGNNAAATQVQDIFDGLTDVFVADNVRPALETEALEDAQLQLALAFDRFAESHHLGFEAVGRMTRLGVLPNAQSYNLIVDYLGRAGKRGKRHESILALDVGSAVSTMSASVEGHTATSIRTDIGLGHSARALLSHVGLDAIRAWLPFYVTDNEIYAYAINKSLRPATVPDTARSLYMEHAFLRAAVRALLKASRPAWTPERALDDLNKPLPEFRRIIGAGAALANTERPDMAAMLLLDALQPVGVSQLQLDGRALIPALGALARINPQAVVQVLDGGGLEDLCTSFSISGKPRLNRVVARVTISKENGETEKHDVMGGTLWVYPLSLGVKATVRVRLKRGMRVGDKRRIKLEVEGGTTGLIIDARGRPLPLARDPKALAAQLPEWYAQVTGDPIREINLDWLEEAVLDTLSGGALTEQRELEEQKHESTGRKRRRLKAKAAQAPSAESLIQAALEDPEMSRPGPTAKRGRRIGRRAANEASVRDRQVNDIDDLRNLFP